MIKSNDQRIDLREVLDSCTFSTDLVSLWKILFSLNIVPNYVPLIFIKKSWIRNAVSHFKYWVETKPSDVRKFRPSVPSWASSL